MKRVAVFYSLGPHFQKTVLAARTLGEHVTAIVPPHLDGEQTAGLVDETVVTDRAGIAGLWRVLRLIRGGDYDALVIMFDSPKQRVLSSLGGTEESWYCAPHGRLTRVEGSAISVVITETIRRIRGRALYVRIWVSVRIRRVKNLP